MRWNLKFAFCPSGCFFLLPLELIDKLQNCHSSDIVLSASQALNVSDSLFHGELLKYCLGQFLIWSQFAETINSFLCLLFFFGTCLTTATLFLSFNRYFYQTWGQYLSVLKVIQNFALCYRATKISYLPWKFRILNWFLQRVEPIFWISFSFWQSRQFQPQNHPVLYSHQFAEMISPMLLNLCTHLDLWLWGWQSSFSRKELKVFFHLARMKNNSNIQGL